jgi:hypothetical protein
LCVAGEAVQLHGGDVVGRRSRVGIPRGLFLCPFLLVPVCVVGVGIVVAVDSRVVAAILWLRRFSLKDLAFFELVGCTAVVCVGWVGFAFLEGLRLSLCCCFCSRMSVGRVSG